MTDASPCEVYYRLVYSVIQEGYSTWPFAAVGLALVVGSILGLRFSKKRRPWLLFLFSVLWTAVAFFGTYAEYQELRNALLDGSAALVEGTVTNFSPEPPMGHAHETFDVAGVHFAYQGLGTATAAFNRSKPRGGPIREGVQVRIWHVRGKIARLEVGDHSCTCF